MTLSLFLALVFKQFPTHHSLCTAQLTNESKDNSILNNNIGLTLNSDQQISLIKHWDNPISLYKHIKEKFTQITNLCRNKKLQQLSESDEDIDDSDTKSDDDIVTAI